MSEGSPPIVVQKYGGSSVADVDKIGRVAELIVATKKAGNAVVVVVSAMGKTTDSLLGLANSAAMVEGVAAEPARRELDMLLTTGERVSMSLLSIAIQARGVAAISFTGSQSGILTNDRHFDARIIEVRPHRIEDELARDRVVIVAGYQGMSYKREITTLGRGGSDTTAVALAAALGADRCEIYSDVDGVYSADPRVVADARHLPELDHTMLQEMAEAGAKVVCAQAIEWAKKQGIILHARSTFDPARQTVIRPAAGVNATGARVVTGEPKVLLCTWSGVSVGRVASALSEAGAGFKDLTAAGDGGSVLLPLLNVPSVEGLKTSLTERVPGLHFRDKLATVSVVGDGLANNGGVLSRFLETLHRAEIEPAWVGGGPLRISGVVGADRYAKAQQVLHEEFVGGG